MKGKLLRLGLLSSLVVASVGCDPGVHYRPRDWTQVDAVHWRTDVGGVSLTMRPIGGLIGETWLDPDIEIQNLTSVAVTMVSATLGCGRASYPADTVGLSGTRDYLSPGEARKLNLHWRFQRPIGEVLHTPVSMSLELTVGNATRSVAVPMTRFYFK